MVLGYTCRMKATGKPRIKIAEYSGSWASYYFPCSKKKETPSYNKYFIDRWAFAMSVDI